ncbi:2-aminoethanethiol (cysteamine) dioxygenase b [Lampris incognitus]|uniref:2-aminoethanethiol (cysteamine) dioxygenase b n=1 Tax=Lampris incognitus TaxID=2546036 RepID=UPI0024B49BF5|nr:2-aminoethanethiol (cysteamine) dioxygenase b [Lampris incognitus]
MMPQDSMTSIVQRLARQARVTFRNPPLTVEASKTFLENQNKLKSMMTEVRATDLKLVPRKMETSPVAPHPYRGVPPVTYMQICETDEFSMGVFLLRNGASIPLHDHPGMHGMLKVLYGKLRITCFDRLDKMYPDATPGDPHSLPPFQTGALRRSVVRSTGDYTDESMPCILSPDRDNLHQIDAVDGPTAFLDVLAPPYDPDDGRDCHYYEVLPPPPVRETGAKKTPREAHDQPMEVWLMEIPQPPDFWCGGEPYPGPEVSL